jgi:predicted site-specific integrase-resolvase
MNENEMPRSLSTAKEAAKLLGICQDTLRKLAKDGKIYREPRSIGSPFYLYDAFTFLSASGGGKAVLKKKETVFYCRENCCDLSLMKGFLQNQVDFAKKLYPNITVLSGNSYDITNDIIFDALLDRVIQGEVGKIIIFGKKSVVCSNIRYFKLFLSRFGVEVIDLNIYMKLVRDINKPSFKNFNDLLIPDKIIKTPAFHTGFNQDMVYVSSQDAASILGVHRKTVINRANRGIIPIRKILGSSIVRYGVLNKINKRNSKRNIFYYLRENNIDVMDNECKFMSRPDLTKEYEILYDNTIGERSSLINIIKDICDGNVDRLVLVNDEVFGIEHIVFKYLFSKAGTRVIQVLL